MITIAADPKHLGARIGVLSVLHTWGSALTHHPHVHMIVPGGGISLDRTDANVIGGLDARHTSWKEPWLPLRRRPRRLAATTVTVESVPDAGRA